MLASSGLITAPCGEPCTGVHLSRPLQDIGFQPAADQIEHPAIDDLVLDPCHQRVVRNRIEVRLQVGIHHVGVAVLDQPIDLAQRIVAPSPRTEAVASVAEPALEYRFNRRAAPPAGRCDP